MKIDNILLLGLGAVVVWGVMLHKPILGKCLSGTPVYPLCAAGGDCPAIECTPSMTQALGAWE